MWFCPGLGCGSSLNGHKGSSGLHLRVGIWISAVGVRGVRPLKLEVQITN